MSVVMSDACRRLHEATRVLLAVHGGEPAGWGLEARRVVAMWKQPTVRILAILAVPSPLFTSLIPIAARKYRAARAGWEDAERERLQRVIDEVTLALPAPPDVAWAPVTFLDPARGIAEHARTWCADVLLLGATRSAGLWLGTVHDRVLRQAGCPVLLMPRPRRRQEA
jgi:nucleotide-binding universal stress UspA family protein